MKRSDYAFPCGGCICNLCANNLYSEDKTAGEAKIFCDACEWCRWYDGDTKNPDKWKQECDEYIITEEQAKRNRKKFKIVKEEVHIMKTIALINQKAGIGKTLTAASIAYLLGEEQGKKVLLVDADQQGNVSMLYDLSLMHI